MKKITILPLILMLTLAACSKRSDGSSTSEQPVVQQAQPKANDGQDNVGQAQSTGVFAPLLSDDQRIIRFTSPKNSDDHQNTNSDSSTELTLEIYTSGAYKLTVDYNTVQKSWLGVPFDTPTYTEIYGNWRIDGNTMTLVDQDKPIATLTRANDSNAPTNAIQLVVVAKDLAGAPADSQFSMIGVEVPRETTLPKH